ncbi:MULTISPECIES: hypothetical protein [unclassified Nocardia]|uniref:hypothetical protein n=1 Tax=unclassified Nocardia TaxID=2637762 RepID=UPI0033A0F99B
MSAPATSIAGPALGSSGARRRPVSAVPVARLVGWVFVVATTGWAFRRTWREIGVPVDSGYAGFGAVLFVLVGMAALGIATRRGPALARDPVADMVIGLTGLIAATGLLGVQTVRLGVAYLPLRLDLLAAWAFAISASVLVFGVRSVVRFWPVWVLPLALLPPVYGAGQVLLGEGGVLVLLAGCAVAVVVGGVAAAAATVLIGAAVVIAVDRWFPGTPQFGYQVVPLVVGVAVVLAARGSSAGSGSSSVAASRPRVRARAGRSASPVGASIGRVIGGGAGVERVRSGGGGSSIDRPVGGLADDVPGRGERPDAHTGGGPRRRVARLGIPGAGVVLVAAAVSAWIPVPRDGIPEATTVTGVVAGEGVVVPGWNVLESHRYPWAANYFEDARLGTRSLLEAEEIDPDWDAAGRKRRVAVDVLGAGNGDGLDRYPDFAHYRLAEPRFGPPSYFELGAGVVGRMRTVVDDHGALRWTLLSWDWRGAGGAERVTLIASTDHLPTAVFPEPDGSLGTTASAILRQALRGRSIDGGPAVLADSDLLLTLAHLLVAVRTGAR